MVRYLKCGITKTPLPNPICTNMYFIIHTQICSKCVLHAIRSLFFTYDTKVYAEV